MRGGVGRKSERNVPDFHCHKVEETMERRTNIAVIKIQKRKIKGRYKRKRCNGMVYIQTHLTRQPELPYGNVLPIG